MREAAEKRTFQTLKELIDPAHTAVVVIDMQNDPCSPHGRSAEVGIDMSMVLEIIPRTVRLLEEARKHQVPIIFLQLIYEPHGQSSSPAILRLLRTSASGQSRPIPELLVTPPCLEGTWGAEIIPELNRQPHEPVVVKHRSGGFANTTLDTLLRSMAIQTTLMVGEQTAGCVAATVRGANDLDYIPVIVTDCIAGRDPDIHEAAMKVLTYRWDSPTSEDIIAAWESP